MQFTEDSIFVLLTAFLPDTMMGHAVFMAVCPKCKEETFVMTRIANHEETIDIQTKPGSGVSVNEILDMHNFLKDWKGGDVSELFKKH